MTTRQVRLATDVSGLDDDDGSVFGTSIGSPAPPPQPPPSGSAIVKQGWLQKSDPHGSHWKQRWCVLLSHAFYYYIDSETKDSKLKGAFELRQAKLVIGWDMYKKSPTNHVFQLQLPKRQYYFCAATATELLEWRQAIEGVLGTPQQKQPPPEDSSRQQETGRNASPQPYSSPPLASPGAQGEDPSSSSSAAAPAPGGAVLVMEQQGRYGSWVPTLSPGPRAASPSQARPPAPPPPPPPSDVTFYVLLADPALGGDKRFTMVVRSDKVAALTFGKVRRNLAKAVGGGVAPERLLLTVEGDSTPLEDAWSGEGLIHDRVQLRLRILEEGEGGGAVAAAGAGAGAGGLARGSGGDSAARPPLSAAATGSSSRSGFDPRAGGPPAAASAAAAAALERRGRLRRLFDGVAAAGGNRGAADRAELAATLAADPECAAAPEHETLLWRLLGSSGAGGPTITWEAFSAELEAAAAAQAAAARAQQQGAEEEQQEQQRQQQRALSPSPAAAGAAAAAAARDAEARGGGQTPRLPSSRLVTAAAAAAAAASAGGPRPGGPDGRALVSPRGSGAGGPASAAAAGPAGGGPRHVMVLKVDVPGGAGEAAIHIRAGDDARALAADFVRAHGLPPADYVEPLADEIRKTLIEAFTLELADERAAHAGTRQALGDAQARLDARASGAEEAGDAVVALRERVAELEAQLRDTTAAAAAAAARSRSEAEQASVALRRQTVAHQAGVDQLRAEVAAAHEAAAAAQAQTRAVSDTLAALEAAKRAQAWDRYVDGGAAASDYPPLPGAASDWRTWAAEKRELLERANADRAALVEENKRLRASLDTRGVDMEARLRGADHEIAQLRSDLHALAAARNQAEAELRSVYQQWESDGRRWAGERRRQAEQVEALSAAAAGSGGGATQH